MLKNVIGRINSAEILCVGTELLMGQIVNTNAAYIARELVLAGIPSYRQSVVGDNPGRLAEAILLAAGRSDAVILTGGLGPTEDDITMAVTAEALGRRLLPDADSADHIRSYFHHAGREMPPSNLKQSFLPEGCIILPNRYGTAPGAIIETEAGQPFADPKVFMLLPGPPSEMHPMFDEAMQKYLKAHAPVKIRSEFIRLFGIGESAAEQRIKDIIQTSRNPTVAPYCSEGECMFRVSYTSSADDGDAGEEALAAAVKEVKGRLGEYIYEIGSRPLPQVAFEALASHGATVSFAESCTGGMLGAAITDFPGSSAVFKGGVIVYTDHSKIQLLNVPEKLILIYGAVSLQTAEAMAEGCRRLFDSDYAVAVTGLAGPGGGSDDKPVGLVYISLTGPEGTVTRELKLKGGRARIRRAAMLNVFDMLRRTMEING
ncbi:MAG: competence/damage-inducible protein A [Saccharofermentanales bacterium]